MTTHYYDWHIMGYYCDHQHRSFEAACACGAKVVRAVARGDMSDVTDGEAKLIQSLIADYGVDGAAMRNVHEHAVGA
jgi:hypothetical protein